MDVIILDEFLGPILTVITVWNTGKTGDINIHLNAILPNLRASIKIKCKELVELSFTVSGSVIPSKDILHKDAWGLKLFETCKNLNFTILPLNMNTSIHQKHKHQCSHAI